MDTLQLISCVVVPISCVVGIVLFIKHFTKVFVLEIDRIGKIYSAAIEKMGESNDNALKEMTSVLESMADRLMSKSLHDIPRATVLDYQRPVEVPEDGFAAMRAKGLDPYNLADRDKWDEMLGSEEVM